MIAVVIVGVLAITLALLEDVGVVRFGLIAAFFVLFAFLALRYNFGNDYAAYLAEFEEVNKQSAISFLEYGGHMEVGWVLLCKMCEPIGFFGMVGLLSAFTCGVHYWLIRAYVPKGYYWFAVFLYVFSPYVMLVQASAMRQSLAISLFMASLFFVNKKMPVRYLAFVGAASVVHTSALVVIPTYLLSLIRLRVNYVIGIAAIVCVSALFISGEVVGTFVVDFVNAKFPRYAVYDSAGQVNSGLGILAQCLTLGPVLYFERFQNRHTALLFKLGIVSFLFVPLGVMLQLIGRLGMYFTQSLLVVFPIVASNIRNRELRVVCLALYMLSVLYSFYAFFGTDIWRRGFGTYQTILSAPQWY